MRAFTSLFLATLLAVALLPSLRVSRQAAPATQEDVLTRSARIGDGPLPASSAFQGALQMSGVPGGVAFMEGGSDQPLPMVLPQGSQLRERLTSIMDGDSVY